MPTLYAGSNQDEEENIRLGRATEWLGGDEGAPVRGRGQRMLMVGDEARPILEIQHLDMKSLGDPETIHPETSAPEAGAPEAQESQDDG